jgi:hypothetical protein
MATSKIATYSDPNCIVRKEACMPPTTAGATTEGAKFRAFQKFRLKAVHVGVITAGTSTAHGYDIFRGTTSVGTITVGTAAAHTTASSSTLNLDVAAMQQISVKSLADVVGVAQIVYEYETQADAVATV